MRYLPALTTARAHAVAALDVLARYQPALDPWAPANRELVAAARAHVSPGATSAGAQALDAARWERWVGVRQLREAGEALRLLDRAWWAMSHDRGVDVAAARASLHGAVALLDRAARPGRWYATAAAGALSA